MADHKSGSRDAVDAGCVEAVDCPSVDEISLQRLETIEILQAVEGVTAGWHAYVEAPAQRASEDVAVCRRRHWIERP